MTRITTALREQLARFHQLNADLRQLQVGEQNLRSTAGADVTACLDSQAACQQEIAALRVQLVPELERAVDDEATEALAQLLSHLEQAAEANAALRDLERFASEAASVAGRTLIPQLHWPELSRESGSRYVEWLRHLPDRLRQAVGDGVQQSVS